MARSSRRLAAIMFTDIVGYTALSQRDESLALRLLKKHRELVRTIIRKFGGEEIKTMGDAFLIEFQSALDATKCAVEIQRSLHVYNSRAAKRLEIRIGIHIGDVVHQKGDVYGDAVNIASRIEPLAEGGEVCISEQVYDQVRNKLPYRLERLESQNLKNVAFPIDVYKVIMPWMEDSSRKRGDGESAVSMVRRYPTDVEKGGRTPTGKMVLKLTLKNNIIAVALKNDPEIPRLLGKFSSEVDYSRGETLHIVAGVETVKVVTDSKNLERLEAAVPKKHFLSVTQGLAEIVISLSEMVVNIPGVVALISSHLAKKGVNLIEYITSSPHAIVVVQEKDALKSYQILEELAMRNAPLSL